MTRLQTMMKTAITAIFTTDNFCVRDLGIDSDLGLRLGEQKSSFILRCMQQ